MPSFLNQPIDQSWTLFLDRDGVINTRIVNDYVKSPAEFHFLPGVINAIAQLSKIFGRIVVVTNQQGIGKGLYSHEDLAAVHTIMKATVDAGGGRIDEVYYAPQLSAEKSPMRKPEIGMALAAKAQFPEIDFAKSIMVGDSVSDMEFALKAGMKAVFCSEHEQSALADMRVASLAEFASYIAAS